MMQFHFQLTQDKRAELMSSQGYSYASNTMLYGLPTWAFCSTWATTGFMFCGVEAAFSAYFGVDIYDKAERSLQNLRPYLPSRLQTPLTWTENTLWGIGWYRNTSIRLGVETIRQGSSYVLSHFDPSEYGLGSQNYFTHINMTGALFYTVEELGGRRVLGPYIQAYIPSLEAALNTHLGVPTINELTALAGETLNSQLEEALGINLKEAIIGSYDYFRKEIAGVKPTAAQLDRYFEENIATEIKKQIKATDPAIAEMLLKGAKVIFRLYYEAQDDLQANMNDWLEIANRGFTGHNNYALFNAVVTDLAANGADYSELAAMILFQPHLVENYGFSPGVVKQKYVELIDFINANRSQETTDQAKMLSKSANFIDDSLKMTYLQTRKWGQEVENDYINTLVSIFGHDRYKTPSGRAEHFSWEIIKNNPLVFRNMSSEERSQYAEEFKKKIQLAQRGHSKRHEQRALDVYNQLNVFYGSRILNQSFSKKEALNLTTHSILNQYEAIEARAAFAVHHVQEKLAQSKGYVPLSIQEETELYFAVIDVHYLGSLTKTEEALHGLVWTAFQSHAIDKSNYAPLAGLNSLDEAATHVFVTSRDAAEGRWAGSTEDQTRVVPVVQHSTFKQILNFLKENSSGSVGVGAQTNGGQPIIGVYNFANGQLTPFSRLVGLPPVGKFNFILPAKVGSSSSNPSTYDMQSLLFTMTNANRPVNLLDKLWDRAIDKAVAEMVHLPTEQDYFETFSQTLQKHQQESLDQNCSNIVECVYQHKGKEIQELGDKFSQAIETIADRAQRIAAIAAENPPTLVCEKPDTSPSLLEQISPIRSANAALPLVCAPMIAPIVVEEVILAAIAVKAIFTDRPLEDNRLEFPIHQEANDGIYPGEPADASLRGPAILTTPAGEPHGLEKLETLLDQPKPDASPFIFPPHNDPLPFVYNYVKDKLNINGPKEIKLFRAVTIPEYEQIKATANFQGIGNNIKYFTKSLEEAKRYASKDPYQEYVIVSTTLNSHIKGNSQANVDGGISALTLQDKDLFKLSPPVIVDQKYLLNDYTKQANGQVMKLPGTYTGFSYSKQNIGSSVTPYQTDIIQDQETGQKLLDSAYVNPTKPGQLFNYHQGEIIRFSLTPDNVWQARIVDKNVPSIVGTDVLRALRNNELISAARYKELLKM